MHDFSLYFLSPTHPCSLFIFLFFGAGDQPNGIVIVFQSLLYVDVQLMF